MFLADENFVNVVSKLNTLYFIIIIVVSVWKLLIYDNYSILLCREYKFNCLKVINNCLVCIISRRSGDSLSESSVRAEKLSSMKDLTAKPFASSIYTCLPRNMTISSFQEKQHKVLMYKNLKKIFLVTS